MDAYYAKQPILNLINETCGYELLYRTSPEVAGYTGADGDLSTADVLNNVFFGGDPAEMLDGKLAFVNFTENLLLEGTAKLLPKDIIVVEILENIEASQKIVDCCVELKKLGYTLALDDYVYNESNSVLFPMADIVKIDFRVPKEDIISTAERCREQNKIMLAEKVETAEEVQFAKSLGCTLMQGYYFAKPLLMTHNTQRPTARTFMQLTALLENPEPDIDEIDRVIATDAALTLKLLRLVNAVRRDTSEKIATVKQALVMLGIRKIKEWVYLVSLQQLSNDEPEETVRLALMRACFCGAIAKKIPSARMYEQEMYLMGLMSLVAGSGNKNKAVDQLPVSDNIKNGLKGVPSVFSDIFVCARAYERARWDIVDKFAAKYKMREDDFSSIYFSSMKHIDKLFSKMN